MLIKHLKCYTSNKICKNYVLIDLKKYIENTAKTQNTKRELRQNTFDSLKLFGVKMIRWLQKWIYVISTSDNLTHPILFFHNYCYYSLIN